MSEATRRGFLAAAGVGAAGLVAGTVGVGGAGGATAAEEERLPVQARGSMAAYVRDVQTGEVAVMIEDARVVVTDKVLVARLARAFHDARRA